MFTRMVLALCCLHSFCSGSGNESRSSCETAENCVRICCECEEACEALDGSEALSALTNLTKGAIFAFGSPCDKMEEVDYDDWYFEVRNNFA